MVGVVDMYGDVWKRHSNKHDDDHDASGERWHGVSVYIVYESSVKNKRVSG